MNTFMHRRFTAIAFVLCLAMFGKMTVRADSYPNTAVDNTKMNQGNQNAGAVTADHAKQYIADRDIMSQIRKSIVQDHSLSTYAHNVKIIARNGFVTLKGPVRSTDEKQTVMAKATAVVGTENVADQMTVKEKSN